MLGLMQDQPLMIASIITHAARHHPRAEIVSKSVEGAIERITYLDLERRARRLVRVLQRLGVRPTDRVATLAWNSARHVELYYAISGMQAVCHTVNPRLSAADVAFIVTDAGDGVIFADTTFAPLIAAVAPQVRTTLRAVVFMTEAAHMPDIALPEGMDLLCYEDLMADADEEFVWPTFDERTAASLCYTSGTTGRPKGVLYSHRSTLLHAYSVNAADVLGLRATDRALPVVPMFHVNAWGIPYAAPMAGASLVMAGRHLDGASVAHLMNAEGVTFSAGVPTVWLGLLNHLRTSGERLATVKRLVIGGSACPPLLFEGFDAYGVRVEHAWGMTEMSPIGSFNSPTATTAALDAAAAMRLRLKQGRVPFGIDMRIVDDEHRELPWDGATSGHLMVRGPWVTSAYYGDAPGSALDAEGWFATGDVATMDADGFMEITDRSKDVVKSGGEWISSIALENLAMSHPDVAEAAIVAARHEKWGERPLLVVVPRAGRTIDKANLLAIYKDKVASWWLPDDVVVVDELPHTATGKVQKLALRERFAGHLEGTAQTS
jgi:acyl-CoA synthetase (AMP-forming)/AMP-acid ligase II